MHEVDEATAAYLQRLLESAPPIPLDAVEAIVKVWGVRGGDDE